MASLRIFVSCDKQSDDMKDFVKMTLAAILGCIVVGAILMFMTFGIIGSLASLGNTQPVMPREGILTVDMSRITLTEQAVPTDIRTMIEGETRVSTGIWTAIRAIQEAALDPAIRFIYLKPDGVAGEMGCIEELRTSLERFRSSGKAIISFIETPSNASYYLASVSDKIFMSGYDGGMNMITGFSSSQMFLKDILDRLGVNVQLIRHGKYKSAGEMFIRNGISPENREQNQVMVNSLWKGWADRMAGSRGLSFDEFNALVDNLSLNSPEDFLEHGLVDELMTKEELRERLCGLYGAENIEDIRQVTLPDYAAARVLPNYKAKEKIAIIYANGNIVDGEAKEQVAGDRFAAMISAVRRDSSVRAVVLRVNSPGGSVLASSKIRNEIDLTREVKPVIASYGSYAASGGYWISSSCDRIFSDASTLTGSIGVFSMIPDFSKTAEKIGIGTTTISSNRHGDMYSGMRALDNAEIAYMQESVEDIYDTFTAIVAEGRGLDREYVDEIAQGRVWAGTDALDKGLVDQIGGIEDAVSCAISMTGSANTDIGSWLIEEYPKPMTTMDMLMEMLGQNASVFAGTPLEAVETAFRDWDESMTGQVYARMPYEISIR